MTHQNIIIDRIKKLIKTVDCFTCPFFRTCSNRNDNKHDCSEIIEWLNEQYI